MSKRLFISIVLLFLFFINLYSQNRKQKELFIRPETSELLNKAELAITNPDEFFDGKKANKNDIILPVINIPDSKNEINDRNEFRYSPSSIQSFSINRITVPIPPKTIIKGYKSDDKTVIDKALGILRKYGLSGVYSKDIKIEWKDLEDTDFYAQSKPDKWALGLFGTRHIELNTKYKDVLNTPEYLAVILAHELSHQYDFDLLSANGSTLNNWAYNYITEEKAYQVQLYIYEKLLKEKPYLFNEKQIEDSKKSIKIFIEINKFLKAVWDYKNNNGKIPTEDDFPLLRDIKAFNGKFKNMIDSLKDDKNFIGPYTFHSFITLGYYKNYPDEGELKPEDAKRRLKEANDELKKKLKDNEIMNKFISVRNSLISDIYLPYCGVTGVKPPSNYLDMPSEISSGQSNQDSGNNGSSNYHDSPADDTDNNDNNSDDNQQPPNDNDGEIGIDPGPPPTPPENPPDVDWDGSGGHWGS